MWDMDARRLPVVIVKRNRRNRFAPTGQREHRLPWSSSRTATKSRLPGVLPFANSRRATDGGRRQPQEIAPRWQPEPAGFTGRYADAAIHQRDRGSHRQLEALLVAA